MTTVDLTGIQVNSQTGIVSFPDLASFVNATAILLLMELPLQSLDSAVALVYAYISSVGGWTPTNPLDPEGAGQPFNGYSEQHVADDITTKQFKTVYDLNFSVTLNVNVQFVAQLTEGLSLDAAAGSMTNQVAAFITNSINDSSIPIQVPPNGIVAQVALFDFSMICGCTNQTIRQTIAANIANISNVKEVDYKGLALLFVQNKYGVDPTWNVQSVYTELNQPIVVLINKYTDTTYETLDLTNTATYVMNVSPDTYQIVSGVLIN